MMAPESVEGLGLGDGARQKDMVLRKLGVKEDVALCVGINSCGCLNKLGCYLKFNRNVGEIMVQLIFTKYRRANKDIPLNGSLPAK
jgi:hypothetical protein